MCCESSDVVRFDLGPLLQGQTRIAKLKVLFTPQPLRAVGVLFSPMVSGWAGGRKKFDRAVSQKP